MLIYPTIVTVKKTLVSALAVSLAVIAAGPVTVSAAEVTFNSKRNCDTNSILHCGAMNTAELQDKYTADSKAKAVYTAYNINEQDVQDIGAHAVAGSVSKSGNVEVNGKVVANSAESAGYHNMPGSTAASHGGVTFYNSPPSSSFVSERIDAYVVLNQDGQFRYAILASCGNPVKAVNLVEKPKPQPQPQPVPAPEVPKPVETPPAPAPAPAPVEELPAAGAAPIAGLFVGASAIAGTGHALYMRRRNRS